MERVDRSVRVQAELHRPWEQFLVHCEKFPILHLSSQGSTENWHLQRLLGAKRKAPSVLAALPSDRH